MVQAALGNRKSVGQIAAAGFLTTASPFLVGSMTGTSAIMLTTIGTSSQRNQLLVACRIALTLLAVRYESDALRAEHAHASFNLMQWAVSLLVRRRDLAG